MITDSLRLAWSQIGGGFDADAQAFIDAVGTLTTPQQTAIDNLVKGLKANGTWSKYYAIYPLVGGTAAAHKWNLKDPRDLDVAFRLTYTGTITHNANGMTGDGDTGFARTYLIPSSVLTLGNIGMNFYCRSNNTKVDGIPSDMGSESNSSGTALQIRIEDNSGGNNALVRMSTSVFNVNKGNTDRVGNWDFRRDGTTTYLYKNGALVGSGTIVDQALPPYGMLLMGVAIDPSGNPYSGGMSAQNYSFFAISEMLNATQISDNAAILEAYQTALGRNN